VNQQTVTESRVFQKDPASFYLGIARPENSIIRAGAPVAIQCIAVTPEGKPLDHLVDVQIEVIQKRHQTVRVKGAGKSVSFRTTDIDETIGETHGQTVMPTLTASLWSIPEGKTGEGIAQLFRSFHSVKGLTRALDLGGLEAIAQAAENAQACENKGDTEEAREWRHIEDAMKMMRGPHLS